MFPRIAGILGMLAGHVLQVIRARLDGTIGLRGERGVGRPPQHVLRLASEAEFEGIVGEW